MESNLGVVVEQLGLGEVVSDYLRTGRETRLDPRLGLQAFGGGIARKQRRAEHHRWVRCIGAARDGGDEHGAIFDLEAVFARHLADALRRRILLGAFLSHLRVGFAVNLLERAQRHAILRPLRAGERGLDRAHVELEHVCVVGLRRAVVAPHALRLGVGLDERDLLLAAAREFEIAQRLFIDREDATGAAVFGRHVGDGGAIGKRQVGKPVTKVFDELLHDAFLAQHLGDGEHEIGRRRTGLQLPRELEADDLRDEHGDRLAEHCRFRFDAAHAPAKHAETIDHGGMRVGADEGVGVSLQLRTVAILENHAAEELEVDLVHDARVRRNHLEIAERRLTPAQERVALAIALELDLGVLRESIGSAVVINLHRVIDDEFSGC